MKKILFALFTLLCMRLSAQEQLGPASFTVPAGWEITRSANSITLKKPTQKGTVCKITISLAQKGAVTTAAEYLKYRNQNSYPGVTYLITRGAVSKSEANGLTSFFSKGTVAAGKVNAQNYFYSLSNGAQTLHYQLLTSNNECVAEFNQFMSGLTMEANSNEAAQSNARRKKAAAATPAAPAPMM